MNRRISFSALNGLVASIVFSLSVVLAASTCSAADDTAPPKPTAPPEPAGMKSMFDGKTLDGWDGDPRLWSVKDGCIHGQTTAETKFEGNTFLIWKGGEPGDFDLRLSFRLDPENSKGTGNSGVQYRSRHITEGTAAKNKWVMGGYQAEIANVPGKDGFLYNEQGPKERHREDKGTPLYLALVGEKAVIDDDGLSHPVGSVGDRTAIGSTLHTHDWNDYVIIARGNHLQHFINGVQTIDCVDNDPKGVALKGLIALQIHNGKPMAVEFKNLRIKEFDHADTSSKK
jgi:hypothetical protein